LVKNWLVFAWFDLSMIGWSLLGLIGQELAGLFFDKYCVGCSKLGWFICIP
jgi:hypothetical protein